MMRTVVLRSVILALAALSAACGPASVRPASYSDPTTPCPGGQTRWKLEILDRRAERVGAEQMTAAIRNGIQQSFAGCQWAATAQSGAGTITIEIHRFASVHDSDAWEAAADWTVRATNAGERTLTEFEANEEVSRPNYRGSDNEKESMTQAFHAALQRTVNGLRALPAIGVLRPREGTPPAHAGSAPADA